MDLITKQLAYEMKSTHHLVSHIKEDFMSSDMESYVTNYVKTLKDHILNTEYEYKIKSGEIRIHESKKARHEKLLAMDLNEVAWKIIAIAVASPMQSFTAAVGHLRSTFRNKTIRQDIEQASECLALLKHTGLVTFISPKNSEDGQMMIQSNVEFEGPMHEFLTKTRHIMPSLLKPKEITNNKTSGYQSFGSSLILGGKYHERPVPLDHINRKNSIKLSIDPRTIYQEPIFKEKEGEDSVIREDRYKQWKQLNIETVKACAELVTDGNEFYLTHKYDERLRTYVHGHQINYQGDAFRKSLMTLAKKEIIPL